MADHRLPGLDPEGLSPEEAFGILGDETRLDIVRALWSAGAMHLYDDVDETDATVTYSELQRAVDVTDNGRFNYHLSKLRPQFITKTEAGYRLSGAGKKVARGVVAASGGGDPLPGDLAVSCPLCGGAVAGSYEDSWLRFACTECDGLFGDAAPEGTLLNEVFPPAGLAGRDAAGAYRTKLYRCVLDMIYLMQGVCRECAGPVAASVTVCDDHDRVAGGDPCPACGHHSAAWARLRCRTCRFGKRLPVEFCTLGLLPTLGFLYDHGIDPFEPSLEGMVEMVETRFGLATATSRSSRSGGTRPPKKC